MLDPLSNQKSYPARNLHEAMCIMCVSWSYWNCNFKEFMAEREQVSGMSLELHQQRRRSDEMQGNIWYRKSGADKQERTVKPLYLSGCDERRRGRGEVIDLP